MVKEQQQLAAALCTLIEDKKGLTQLGQNARLLGFEETWWRILDPCWNVDAGQRLFTRTDEVTHIKFLFTLRGISDVAQDFPVNICIHLQCN